jgi:hypothetical protein
MFTVNLSAGALFTIGVITGIVVAVVAFVVISVIYSKKK